MLVVSDTSSITNLIRVGHLDVLNKLFGDIIILRSVYDELIDYEKQQEEIDKTWITVKEVAHQEDVRALQKLLDLGESEAIILAKEIHADLLIIDERKGRK